MPKRLLAFLPLLCLTLPAAPPTKPTAEQQRVRDAYTRLPLAFEPNLGQAAAGVQFLARTAGYGVYLNGAEALLAVTRPHHPAGEAVALRIRLLGANPASEPRGLDPLPGRSNYFVGSDPAAWRAAVRQYAKVAYRDVYPGIDLIYYGDRRELEYDFVVAPGADPGAIRLSLGGARRLRLDDRGDILVTTEAGQIRKPRPRIYQEEGGVRHPVPGGYVLRGKEVRFALGAYDRSRPVVIDPTVNASNLLGGSGDEIAFGVVVDATGVYITGFTTSPNFPIRTGAFRATPAGGRDVFVAKLNLNLSQLLYSTFLGGSGTEIGTGIRVDSAGNAYVAGYTNSPDFPTTPGAFQTTPGGGACGPAACADAFVTKLNPSGSALLYSTLVGGNSQDQAQDMALDSSGSVYLTGLTNSTNLPTTAGAVQRVYGGSVDSFLIKLNPAGAGLVYGSYLGGNSVDFGFSIAIDADGNAFVAGYTFSTNFPTTSGAFRSTALGGTCAGQPCEDAFITKFNPSGTALVYSTYLGGTGADGAIGLAVAPNGAAFVTGYTSSTNFPTTSRALQRTYGGGASDAFITALDPLGQALTASTFFGGSGADVGEAIALHPNGAVVVAFDTNSPGFPARPAALSGEVQQPATRTQGGLGYFGPNLDDLYDYIVFQLTPIVGVTLASSIADIIIDDFLDYVYGVGMGNGSSDLDCPSGANLVGACANPPPGQNVMVVRLPPPPPPSSLDVEWKINSGADMSKTPPQAPVAGNLEYQVTVTNKGPATALNTQMTHQPPAAMADRVDIVNAPPGACLPSSQGEYRCNFGAVQPGQSRVVTFNAVRLRQGRHRLADSLNTKAATTTARFTVRFLNLPMDLDVVQGTVTSTLSSVSAASFLAGGALAPFTIVAGFGQGLATAVMVATSTPLPLILGGTSVRVRKGVPLSDDQVAQADGILAPLFFVSPTQINYMIPEGVAPGTATVTVTNQDRVVATGTLQIEAVVPSLFTANSDGRGVAAALAIRAADGTQTPVAVFQCTGGAGTCTGAPIDLGPESDIVVLLLFGTGIRGASSPQNVTATIGGVDAPVLFAGAQGGFVGLDQVNVQIPRSLAGRGDLDVILTVDGKRANTVTVNIR